MKGSIAIILLLAVSVICVESKLNEFIQLTQLIEISRHGARSPFYDIWDYRTNWDMPLVTLTNVGQRQHFLIGEEIYKRYAYSIFNGGQYDPDQVSVQSTTSDRAQQSALSQLYGIYQQKGQNMQSDWKFNASTDLPPFKIQNGKETLENLNGKNLPNSYVPINVKIPDDLRLLEPTNFCNGDSYLKRKNFYTDVYYQFDASLADFKQEFLEKFGLENQQSASSVTIQEMANYWDSVICDIYQQIPLPSNFTKEFIQKLNFIYDFQQLYLDFNSDNGDFLKLQTTLIFNDIINVIRNQGGTKFKFYSASDGNLNAVLLATGFSSYTTDFSEWLLNQEKHTNTPFASTIFFEIYEESATAKKFIKMIYNDQPIQIVGCSDVLCDFENEFVPSMLSHAILPDATFQSVCNYGFSKSKRFLE